MLVVTFLIHVLHLVHSYYPKAKPPKETLLQRGVSKRYTSSFKIHPYWLVQISTDWDFQQLWANDTGAPFSISCMGPDASVEDVFHTRLVLIHQISRFKNRTLVIADVGADARGRPCKCPPSSNSTVATGSCGNARIMVPSYIQRGANVTGNICVRPQNFTYYVPVSTCDDIGRYVCHVTAPYNNKMVVVENYQDIFLDLSKSVKMRMRVPQTPTVGGRLTVECIAWFAVSDGVAYQSWKWEYAESYDVVDVASFDTRTHNVSVSNSLRVPGLCYLHQMSTLVIDPVTMRLKGKTIRCVFEPYRYNPVRFPCFESTRGYHCCKSYSFKTVNDPAETSSLNRVFGQSTGDHASVGLNAGVVAGVTVGVLALVAAVVGGILYSRGKLPVVSRKAKADEPHECPEVVDLTSLSEPPNEANTGQPSTDRAAPSHPLQVKANANEDRHADADTGNEETL